MIDMPVLDERWIGAAGFTTTCNGVPCKTRAGRTLAEASLFATSPDMFHGDERARFESASSSAGMRRFGGDCYAYALLASGYLDAVIEADLEPYDYLAMVPIIEGAGGRITDWAGGALGLHSGGQVVAAASPEMHAELIAKLRA
jgi:fructose-1,6-bisphosphatase/inositol monophosphatase family enzyme